MSDDYLRRICESYQGESYGQTLFRELAERTEDPERRYKWRALERLEAETKGRLRPLVAELGGDLAESPENAVRGRELAETWAAESWPEVMVRLHEMLPRYVRFFEKLEGMARPGHGETLARVTAHEVAIQEFARLEVEGEGARSIDPVLALLEEPPAREG